MECLAIPSPLHCVVLKDEDPVEVRPAKQHSKISMCPARVAQMAQVARTTSPSLTPGGLSRSRNASQGYRKQPDMTQVARSPGQGPEGIRHHLFPVMSKSSPSERQPCRFSLPCLSDSWRNSRPRCFVGKSSTFPTRGSGRGPGGKCLRACLRLYATTMTTAPVASSTSH